MLGKRRWLTGIGLVLLAGGVVWSLTLASAQERGEERERRGQRAPRMAAPAPGGTAVQLSVVGDYVYVIRGHMLYQLKVEGLELAAQFDLRTEQEKEMMKMQAEMMERWRQRRAADAEEANEE